MKILYYSILRMKIYIIYSKLAEMGVCIGACSKSQLGVEESINAQEKKQIQNNIKNTDEFNSDNCNYITNQHNKFIPVDEVKNNDRPQAEQNKQEILHIPQNQSSNALEGDKIFSQQAAPNTSHQIMPSTNRKNDDNQINLLNRGKNPKDNTLIESTMKDQVTKLGLVELDNGISYQGQWKNAMREGNGTQLWADGSKYVGQWKNNKANGKGVLHHIDGDIYDGQWQNDKANGYGVYKHSNGAKYVGQWKDDKQHGKGTQQWLDGQRYEGQYKNGSKTGKGILKFLDNSYYQGDFVNNEIHGKGLYVWNKNRRYEGQWENNKMHGYGITIQNDGRKYEGQYVNDKKHGIGTFHWPDGRKYHGSWKDGKQHGRGQYYAISGQKKLGQWVQGKRIKWIQENNLLKIQ